MELPNQLAAAHKPDVLAGRRFRHLSMHGADVSGCESDICTRYDGQRARAEDPRRLLIRPRRSGRCSNSRTSCIVAPFLMASLMAVLRSE